MKPGTLHRRWQDQQGTLLRDLGKLVRRTRRRGDKEDVHQLRVTSRRLRQFVRIAAGWYGRKLSRAFRDWSRKTASATDTIRDLDVTLEWLAQQPNTEKIMRALSRLRDQQLDEAQLVITPLPRLLRQRLRQPPADPKRVQRLHRRFYRFQARLEQRARQAAPRFFKSSPDQQHDFRRVIRRWRYLRDLELPKRAQRSDAVLKHLRDLQAALGERQNLRLTVLSLSRLKPTVQTALLSKQAAREARQKASVIRSLLEWLVKAPASQ